MNKPVRLGLGSHMVPIPPLVWRSEVARSAAGAAARLGFMTRDHHRVRDFTVLQLSRADGPLPPEQIAARLSLAVERVTAILDDLEKHLTFVFRDEQGAVVWAYPVTVERTPHRVILGSGEQAYAA